MNNLLIRREVTADRGQAFITTEEVLSCLKDCDRETFTTRDIALILAQSRQVESMKRIEYAVRTSIQWLMERGYVKRTPQTVKRLTQAGEPYWATVYLKVDRMDDCDCSLLNKIFMRD